jgi:hypothetical protein
MVNYYILLTIVTLPTPKTIRFNRTSYIEESISNNDNNISFNLFTYNTDESYVPTLKLKNQWHVKLTYDM